LAPERARQIEDVGGRDGEPIGLGAFGLAREIVAALIRRDNAKAALGQWPEIVAPGEPELGEAVQEDDERSVLTSGRRAMERHAVDGCEAEFDAGIRRLCARPRPSP